MNEPGTTISSVEELKHLLTENPGMIILQFTATWCSPCRRIAPRIDSWYKKLPKKKVQIFIVDIDESIDLYAFMKRKKMLAGVPGLLMYKKGNEHCICDESVNSSSPAEIDAFFERCITYL